MDNLGVSDCTPSKTQLLKSYYKGESPTPVSNLTLREVLVEAADNKPDHVIYRIPEYNDMITLKTLLCKSEEFSRALLYHGMCKGDVVMVLGVPTCDFYAMFHGAVGIGVHFFSPFLFIPKEKAVVELMDASRPKLVILGYECESLLYKIEEYISRSKTKIEVFKYLREDDNSRAGLPSYEDFLKSGSNISDGQLEQAHSQITCMDTTFLQSTSGTTGKFKLGLMNHRILVNLGLFGQARRDSKHERKIFGFCNTKLDDLTPLLDSVSLLCNWRFELQGVVFPSTILGDQTTFLQFLQDEKIESLQAFPYMLLPLINKPIVDQYDLSSWKAGVLVGQAVSKEARQWFHERMPNYMMVYGGTEFLSATGTSPEHSSTEKFLTTVGYPFPHVELKLIDDQDEIADVGRIGEVCLRGWSKFNGYLENGNVADSTDKDGWIRMGDLAKMDSTGHIIFIGRKSDCIRYKKDADCVYPSEIEKVAKDYSAVEDAVVVGIPDDTKGDNICLCVTPKEHSKLEVEELKIFCKNELYSRDLPDFYFIFKSFPTVGSRHKISRDAVMKEVIRRLQDAELNKVSLQDVDSDQPSKKAF